MSSKYLPTINIIDKTTVMTVTIKTQWINHPIVIRYGFIVVSHVLGITKIYNSTSSAEFIDLS